MKVEVFGLQLNMWGLYCAIGALCGFAAIAVVCYSRGMKKGSAPLLTAIPQSASESAGESFTPSPIIITFLPIECSFFMKDALSSGRTSE